MSTITSGQDATGVNGSQGLGERVRSRLPIALVAFEQRARTQWVALPGNMRGAVDQLADRLLARVRSTLDIPSRGEISVLLDRIDSLDAKLTSLSSSKAAAPKAAAPKAAAPKTKTKAKKTTAAAKTARRTRIETSAKKRKR